MSDPRRILAVDEGRTTLDFLRSVLSLVEDEIFEVSGVPSGEEGLLELRRKRYDLLVSGDRLPGMDGLELARRTRRVRPDMPIILTSARPLAELRDEAAALGVSHVLAKPLDAEESLAAVREALSHVPPAVSSPPPEEPEAGRSAPAHLETVEDRLETLCAETGAGQALLVTVGGKLLLSAGSQSHPDLPSLVAAVAASVGCSLHLSDRLDDEGPRIIQFLEGQRYDLYWANVDRDHFIVILFDARVRRGRIGTVWVFAQRAVNELKALLAGLPEDAGSGQTDSGSTPRGNRPGSAEPRAEDGRDQASVDDESTVDDSPQPAERVTDSPPEAAEASPDPELDAFWDEVLASESGADFYTSGISLEEAREKGIIAEDFDPEDQQ